MVKILEERGIMKFEKNIYYFMNLFDLFSIIAPTTLNFLLCVGHQITVTQD